MTIKQALGAKIKKLRKNHKYTQEQFAEMINIAPRTLYGIESGKNFVTAETLEKIMSVLNVSISDLFEGEDDLSLEQMCRYIEDNVKKLKNDPKKLSLFYQIFKKFLNN